MSLPEWYVKTVLWAFHLAALCWLVYSSLRVADWAFQALLKYLGAWHVVLKALVRHVREKQAAAGQR